MIQLASGRRISKQTLFLALHLGGWMLLMLVVAAWEGAIWGFGAATVMDAIYCLGGIAVCLPLRGAFRAARRARWSYVRLGILAIVAAALISPVWWVVDHWLDNVVFETLSRWGH